MWTNFAAVRVRVADEPEVSRRERTGQLLSAGEVCLACEDRVSGERKYYLSSPPSDPTAKQLAPLIKACWICEQARQQLKEEPRAG